MEKNPNHPMVRAMHDQWHKFVALLMQKQGVRHVVITPADIEAMQPPEGCNMTVKELPDGIHLRLVDDKEAARLAREEGGLAIDS